MGTRIVFLCHGQSTYNARRLYQGCCDDSVLTEIGRQTAKKTGAFLRGIQFDAVFTSPLQRARETAELALAAIPNAVRQATVLPLLREADLPNWQGLPFKTVRDRFAADYACWQQTPHQFSMDVERGPHYPALELYSRLQAFWKTILPYYRHQTLLVVAHRGTIRAAIATALGISPANYHAIQQSNCALSTLYFPTEELSSARLEGVNLCTYLKGTLPLLSSNGLRLLLVPSGAADTRDLAALLAKVPIQFSLSGTDISSQLMMPTLLKSQPETTRRQVPEFKLPTVFQEILKLELQNDGLTTGLIVARPEAIAPFLGQAIGLQQPTDRRFNLQPGTLSAIHYPADGYPPVLQALGLCREIASTPAWSARAAA